MCAKFVFWAENTSRCINKRLPILIIRKLFAISFLKQSKIRDQDCDISLLVILDIIEKFLQVI